MARSDQSRLSVSERPARSVRLLVVSDRQHREVHPRFGTRPRPVHARCAVLDDLADAQWRVSSSRSRRQSPVRARASLALFGRRSDGIRVLRQFTEPERVDESSRRRPPDVVELEVDRERRRLGRMRSELVGGVPGVLDHLSRHQRRREAGAPAGGTRVRVPSFRKRSMIFPDEPEVFGFTARTPSGRHARSRWRRLPNGTWPDKLALVRAWSSSRTLPRKICGPRRL